MPGQGSRGREGDGERQLNKIRNKSELRNFFFMRSPGRSCESISCGYPVV